MNHPKCKCCNKEGKYHIQSTEMDLWYCQYHMEDSWKQTQLCNVFRMQMAYPREATP